MHGTGNAALNSFTQPPPQFTSIAELVGAYLEYKWRRGPTKDGGLSAYAIIGGNQETGEINVLFALERGSAPEHEHLDGGPYLEFTGLFGGVMEDIDDSGEVVTLLPGYTLMHRGGAGRIHAPSTKTFCWGYYHQPKGMRLTGRSE